MRKSFGRLTAAIASALVFCAVSASATTITYSYNPDADKVLTTSQAGALVETFNSITSQGFDQGGWNWSYGGAQAVLVDGFSSSGQWAQPYNAVDGVADPTWYLAVPYQVLGSSGSATIDLGQTYNYFGLFWGTIDTYNYLSFQNNGVEVASFTGGSLPYPARPNGGWNNGNANLYVNFFDLPDFDMVTIGSTGVAFEVDNIAVANVVPEPSTMILLGAGLAGFAALRTRRKKAAA